MALVSPDASQDRHCGHVGIADASTLPRALTCSACRASRHVEVCDCRRMASHDAIMERLLAPSAAAAQ
jgi:hypothetical protein